MQHRTVEADGVLIRCLLGGNEFEHTVVILHGLGMSPSVYEPLGERLSKQFRVIIPDYNGLGKEVSFAALAAHLEKLLAVLNVAKADLVPHSMGGGVAIICAKSSVHIGTAVLVGSCGQKPERNLIGWGFAAVRKSIRNLHHPVTASKIVLSFGLNWLRHPVWMSKAFWLTTHADLVSELQAGRTWLVWGEKDEYFGCERMEKTLGIKALVVPNAGHDWLILEPEEASWTISRILGELGSPQIETGK